MSTGSRVSADRVGSQRFDFGRDYDHPSAAQTSYAQSLVLAAGLRGDLLANPGSRLFTARAFFGRQLDDRLDRHPEPPDPCLGACKSARRITAS
jgi:hypothetical protein